MVGGVIGGYCATGRFTIATPPSNIVTSAMTFASTGRSMKNLANMFSRRYATRGLFSTETRR